MEQKDRETLIEIRTDVRWLKESWTEHLKSHKMIRYLIYGALITALFGLLL